MWRKILLVCLLIVVILWIFHTVLLTFITDPGQLSLLKHKHLPRNFHHRAWLDVLDIHVISSCLAMLTGILGLVRNVRPFFRRIHRLNGFIYIPCVLIAVLSAGYLAPNATGGWASSLAFNTWESIWIVYVALAIAAIRKRNVMKHQKWMIRGYSMAFVNTSTHVWLAVFALTTWPYAIGYEWAVWLAGVTNLFVAECVVRYLGLRRTTRQRNWKRDRGD